MRPHQIEFTFVLDSDCIVERVRRVFIDEVLEDLAVFFVDADYFDSMVVSYVCFQSEPRGMLCQYSEKNYLFNEKERVLATEPRQLKF